MLGAGSAILMPAAFAGAFEKPAKPATTIVAMSNKGFKMADRAEFDAIAGVILNAFPLGIA
jgi:hypothetical protein